MLNIFGNGGSCNEGNSTLLWFIILVILLFMKNDDCMNQMDDGCGCGC